MNGHLLTIWTIECIAAGIAKGVGYLIFVLQYFTPHPLRNGGSLRRFHQLAKRFNHFYCAMIEMIEGVPGATTGGVPPVTVPLRVNVCGEPEALSVTVRVELSEPVAISAGVNCISM